MISRPDWKYERIVDNKPVVSIPCIGCRKKIVLEGYTISSGGNVQPKVYCPHCKTSNEEVRLDGWPFEIDMT